MLYAEPLQSSGVIEERDESRPCAIEIRHQQNGASVGLQTTRNMVGIGPATQYDDNRACRVDPREDLSARALFRQKPVFASGIIVGGNFGRISEFSKGRLDCIERVFLFWPTDLPRRIAKIPIGNQINFFVVPLHCSSRLSSPN